jgi:hypothetical protein
MEIRAVLDRSAMLSYAPDHVHVGEIIIEIAAEGAYVGLPAVALLDAYARVPADAPAAARLRVLAALSGATVLPLGAREAGAVARAVSLVAGDPAGDLARAHAVRVALDHGAYYLTTRPETAPPILAADQIHAIPGTDG